MYACEYCTKPDINQIRKDHLLRHKREVHEWLLQFECERCEKKFKRKHHLDRHKPACCRCQRCRVQFKSPQEKKSHVCEPAMKKARIVSEEHAVPVQCPRVQSPTESPSKPQPNEVESPDLQTKVVEQLPPAVQPLPIPSGAPTSVLTCPPLTRAPRRRKSLKIKRPTKLSNIPSPPPLTPKPGLLLEPPRKAETKKKWREVEENEIIHELDPDLERFIHLNWDSIRTFSRRGPVQNLFNFYYSDDVCNLIGRIAKTIMKKQENRFKINYGFGFVLKNIETGEFRYYHASNNSLMLDAAVLISNEAELNEFLAQIADEDFLDSVSRPDTKWRLYQITNLLFFVNHLKQAPLGAPLPLPNFVKYNRGLINVSGDDNQCFFRCLAVFKGADRLDCKTKTRELFAQYAMNFDVHNFNGIAIEDLIPIEDLFKVNVSIYQLNEESARLVYRSRGLYQETMVLNKYQNHLSLITDFEKYCAVYRCMSCDKLHYGRVHFLRHCKTCKVVTRQTYPGGIFKAKETIFDKLAMIGINVPPNDRHFPYYACFDFESLFNKQNLPQNAQQLSYEARHVPLSFGVASNVPGFTEGVCHVSSGDENELVAKLVDYLEGVADASYEILKQKFDYVLAALENHPNCRREKLTSEFHLYLQELPILGFNSSNYDLALIKPALVRCLMGKIKFVLKKANSFLCLKTTKLRFLDIRNFLAPGFSYRKFLIAYGAEDRKFFFPYEFMDSFEKLNFPRPPPHEVFYSSLHQSNISNEEYALVVETWRKEGWSTLKDLLIYYNLLDVAPFVQAISNLLQPYFQDGIDLFKDSFSVSGAAKLKMQREINNGTFFCLFPKRHSDLYQKLRSQLTGGLSAVFCRLAIAGQTKIRPHQVENPYTCAIIKGYDCNALYLHAIMQKNPTGYFCRYREEDDFRPLPACRYGLSCYQWLSWEEHRRNIHIQHQFNGGECRVTPMSLPVDGKSGSQIYQMHGCSVHGCDRCWANRNRDGTLKEFNWRDDKVEELKKQTLEITQKIEEDGYEVISLWECEYKKMKKRPEVAEFVKTLKTVQPRRKLSFDQILKGIQNDTLFGLLIVDIHTPTELKPLFADHPLIIKNTMVSREDIGDYMRGVAEKHGFLKKPKRALICSHFGKEVLITSEMGKFYLEKGLKITKIYEFIEFHPQKCFEDLGNRICDARRLGDLNPHSQIAALTAKLQGNSLYSATLINKDKHRVVTYCDDSTVNEEINNPRFVNLEVVSPAVYEVKSLKKKVINDLPIQIGLFVYLNAKLTMLQFLYDFLFKFCQKEKISLLECDTDSFYCALAEPDLDECVKAEKRREYFTQKPNYLIVAVCENHKQNYVETKVAGREWNPEPCCVARQTFMKRMPGKFKLEFCSTSMALLSPKCYICSGPEGDKLACKGVNTKQNKLTFDDYFQILTSDDTLSIANRGFRTKNHSVYSCKQNKRGLSSFYCKRLVLNCGIETEPLDL